MTEAQLYVCANTAAHGRHTQKIDGVQRRCSGSPQPVPGYLPPGWASRQAAQPNPHLIIEVIEP